MIDKRFGSPTVTKDGVTVANEIELIDPNAGREGAVVVERVRGEKNEKVGFNAVTEEFEDLVQAGVIDPTKMVRTARQNAGSIAGLPLTTEAMISEVGFAQALPGGDLD